MDFARLLLIVAGDSAGAMAAIGETNAGLTEMEARSHRASSAVGLLKAAFAGLVVAGAVMAGIGAISLKMSADFQQSTEKLHTQAGMTQDDVVKVRAELLKLASALGTTPTDLSDGFYHIASAATNLPPALQNVTSELEIYQNAVKLSKIGNADLEASTQAVVGVMAAYASEGMTAANAAATLNAIVGSGDMRMQQLTKAMATGVLPAAHTFGLSLKDVGAALATLTDNVTPADEAATRLRMTFSLMAAPSGAAQRALGALGINATQLGYDMRKPDGLLVAIQDLKTHLGHIDVKGIEGGIKTVKTELEHFGFTTQQVDKMVKTLGPDATEQAFLISKAFGGGRSSAAIMTLLTEFDSFKDKYRVIGEQSAQFGEDWTRTTENLKFKVESVRAAMDAWAIQIGDRLTPVAERFLGWLVERLPDIQNWGNAFVDRLIPAVLQFASAVGQLLPILGPVVAEFLRLLPVTLELAATIMTRLAPVLLALVRDAGALAPALAFIRQHSQVLVPVVIALAAAYVAFRAAVAIVSVIQGVTFALQMLTAVTAGAEAAENALTVARVGSAQKAVLVRLADLGVATQRVVTTAVTRAAQFAEDLHTFAMQRGYLGTMAYVAGLVAQRTAQAATAVVTGVSTAAVGLYNAALIVGQGNIVRGLVLLTAQRVAQLAGAVATGVATAAQWAWNVALTANPIGVVIVGIALLVGALVLLATHWSQVTAALAAAWRWVQQISAAFSTWADHNRVLAAALVILLGPIAWVAAGAMLLISHWTQVVQWVQHVVAAVRQFITTHQAMAAAIVVMLGPVALLIAAAVLIITHWRQVSAFFAGLPGVVGGFFSALGTMAHNAVGAVGQAFSSLGLQVHLALLRLVFIAESLWAEFSRKPVYWIGFLLTYIPIRLGMLIAAFLLFAAQMIGNVSAWANDMVGRAIDAGGGFVVAVVTELGRLPGQVWSLLTFVVSHVLAWAAIMVPQALNTARNFLVAVITELGNLPGQVWSLLAQVVEKIGPWAAEWIPLGAKAAFDFGYAILLELSKLPAQMVSLGQQIAQGVLDGIKDMAGKGAGVLGDFVNGLIAGGKAAAGAASPARAFFPLGRSIPEGVAVGIQQGEPTAQDAMAGLVGGLAKGVNPANLGLIAGMGRQVPTLLASVGQINASLFANPTPASDRAGPDVRQGAGAVGVTVYVTNPAPQPHQIARELAWVLKTAR